MHSMTYKNQLSHLLGDSVKHRIARIWDCLSVTTNLHAMTRFPLTLRQPQLRTLQRFQLWNLGLFSEIEVKRRV